VQLRSQDVCIESQLKIHLLERALEEARLVRTGGEGRRLIVVPSPPASPKGRRQAAPDARIFASGWIRNGLDVAKAVALGADLAGIAGPSCAPPWPVRRKPTAWREVVEVLRIAMFCADARTLPDLRTAPLLDPATAWRRPHKTLPLPCEEEAKGFGSAFLGQPSCVVRENT
jgi:hypothetical protein